MIGAVIGALVGGALGARRKRHFGAGRFLRGGSGSFLNASTILTAGALGWAGYEIWRAHQKKQGVATTPTFSAMSPTSTEPVLGGLFSSPARSTVEVVADPFDGVTRIAGLLVSAARADGDLGEEEYAHILREARAAGAHDKVMAELREPRPLERLVDGVRDPNLASDLYVLAFAVVRADEDVNGRERAWLAELARLLGLDAGSVARLESETAQKIAAAT